MAITVSKTRKLTHSAVLAAITILLAVTPLGYIPINPLITVTIMVTPVALGGLLFGWPYGLFLGVVFGVTSFVRAPYEAIGQILLAQSGLMTFMACVLPRAAVGLLGGAAHTLASRNKRLSKPWVYALTGFSGSMLNTIAFLGFIALAFDSAQTGITGEVLLGIVGFNGSIEAIANGILVLAVGKAYIQLDKKSA